MRRVAGCVGVWLVMLTAVAGPRAAGYGDDRRFELTPFVGYRFSQGFDALLGQVPRALQVEDSSSYGLIFGIGFGEAAQLELLFSRQDSALIGRPTSGGAETPLFDVTVDHYHFGGLYQFIEEPDWIRPFFSFSLGATRLAPGSPLLSSETKFSVGLAAGLKFLIGGMGSRLGIRAQARWVPTWITSSSSIFCDDNDDCFVVVDGDRFDQIEASLGLIVRF